MTEFESLQERVDVIRATGDAQLASRAWFPPSSEVTDGLRKSNFASSLLILPRGSELPHRNSFLLAALLLQTTFSEGGQK